MVGLKLAKNTSAVIQITDLSRETENLYRFVHRESKKQDTKLSLPNTDRFLPRDARSAKRGIAIVSRSTSVCPSVRNVVVS